MTPAALHEHAKYEGIYGSPEKYRGYGHSNHGAAAVEILREWKSQSVVDVGCGHNEFARALRTLSLTATGVDFACPGADVQACATRLPFGDQTWDVLTAFDMLEHILPEQVDAVLAEFARVSRAFIFSIAHYPSAITWQGENLHPTVESEEWWIYRIMRAGGSHLVRRGKFITGRWDARPLRLPQAARVCLVGNGPGVLAAERGALIDAHDEVVRFNAFALRGFEKYTGHRTTLWSNFGSGVLPTDADVRPSRIVFPYGEGGQPTYEPEMLHRIPRWLYAQATAAVFAGTKRTGPALERTKGPTSGLVVAWWLLEVVGVECLSLAGFDHFSKAKSHLHHYWNPKAYGRPPELDGDAEAEIFAQWERDGRVVRLA